MKQKSSDMKLNTHGVVPAYIFQVNSYISKLTIFNLIYMVLVKPSSVFTILNMFLPLVKKFQLAQTMETVVSPRGHNLKWISPHDVIWRSCSRADWPKADWPRPKP